MIKKLFRDYLIRNCKKFLRKNSSYYKFRFFVSIVQTEEEKKVLSFYLTLLIDYIPGFLTTISGSICDAFVFNNTFYILTPRPGLIIGKGGEIINAMENRINMPIHIIETDKYSYRSSLSRAVTVCSKE